MGLFLSAFVILNSCEVTNENNELIEFKFNLDGIGYNCNNPVHFQNISDTRTIYAELDDTTSISLAIPDFELTTYTKAENGTEISVLISYESGNFYSASLRDDCDYSITIDSYDKGTTVLKGTFEAKICNMKNMFSDNPEFLEITNGTFTVKAK